MVLFQCLFWWGNYAFQTLVIISAGESQILSPSRRTFTFSPFRPARTLQNVACSHCHRFCFCFSLFSPVPRTKYSVHNAQSGVVQHTGHCLHRHINSPVYVEITKNVKENQKQHATSYILVCPTPANLLTKT